MKQNTTVYLYLKKIIAKLTAVQCTHSTKRLILFESMQIKSNKNKMATKSFTVSINPFYLISPSQLMGQQNLKQQLNPECNLSREKAYTNQFRLIQYTNNCMLQHISSVIQTDFRHAQSTKDYQHSHRHYTNLPFQYRSQICQQVFCSYIFQIPKVC